MRSRPIKATAEDRKLANKRMAELKVILQRNMLRRTKARVMGLFVARCGIGLGAGHKVSSWLFHHSHASGVGEVFFRT